ncbi:MAG: hypothetical protein J6A89_01235 [Clostridia bacterium]|nr:hypothetical protein [Clostridia bacterium]
MNENNKGEIVRIIIFGIIVVVLSVFAIIVHKNFQFDVKGNSFKININDLPINNLDENKIEQIEGVNGIYYYKMEDYGDFQI